MRNELSALTREASKIRAQLGSERRTVVFRLLDGEGNETGLLNINGTEWTGSTDDVCCLDVVAVAFSALSRRARHTVLHGGRAGGKSWTPRRRDSRTYVPVYAMHTRTSPTRWRRSCNRLSDRRPCKTR